MTVGGNKIIATWLYLEGVDEGGRYPQVKGKSSSSSFHDIYKRCLVTFFLSAKSANPSARLILFSNLNLQNSNRTIDKKVINLLKNAGVEFLQLEYTFQPPARQKNWRNQFFVLDVLQFLASDTDLNDLCLVLDSDIVFSGIDSAGNFWEDLQKNGYLNMIPIINRDEIINGLSLNNLVDISLKLGHENKKIEYAGGEFIALRGDKLQEVNFIAKNQWLKYRELISNDEIPLMEEAHFLSIVYSALSFNFGDADKYIKRIWTQAFHYENRTNSDLHLIFWHLPAEKRFGIRRIATKHLKNPELIWPVYRSEGWKKYVSQLGIRENSMMKIINDISRSVFDRILFK